MRSPQGIPAKYKVAEDTRGTSQQTEEEICPCYWEDSSCKGEKWFQKQNDVSKKNNCTVTLSESPLSPVAWQASMRVLVHKLQNCLLASQPCSQNFLQCSGISNGVFQTSSVPEDRLVSMKLSRILSEPFSADIGESQPAFPPIMF